MKPAHRIAFLLAGAFALGILAGHGVNLRDSEAQGYEGLFADDGGDQAKKDAPLGYPGLIPGYVPGQDEQPKLANPQQRRNAPVIVNAQKNERPRTARQKPSVERYGYAPQVLPKVVRHAPKTLGMTPDPNARAKQVIGSVDDIKLVGLDRQLRLNWDTTTFPPDLEQAVTELLDISSRELMEKPRWRIKGMLPEEHHSRTQVDHIMRIVNDPQLTSQQRKINARKATEKLKKHANGLNMRNNLPDSFFFKMGVPDIYMKEEHEGMEKSLQYVEKALKELKRYQ